MIQILDPSKVSEYYPTNAQEVIDSITNTILEYCNTTFELVERTDEVYDSDLLLTPKHRPISSVKSLSDGGTILVEDTGFYVYGTKIIIDQPTRARKAVKISYISGYSEVPELIKSVAMELLKFRHFRDSNDSLVYFKKQTLDDRAYELDSDLSEDSILSKLDRYVQAKTTDEPSGSRSRIRVGYIG